MDDVIRGMRPVLERVRTDRTAVRRGDVAAWTHEPLTEEALRQHLNGGPRRGCALIPAGSDQLAAVVVDIDAHRGESWEEVVRAACRLRDALEDAGMPVMAVRSGSGTGMHLWVLWEGTVRAADARRAVRRAVAAAGYSEPKGRAAGQGKVGVSNGVVEIFPKQDRVAADGLGSLVWLPYGGKSAPVWLGEDDARVGSVQDVAWMPPPEWAAAPPPPSDDDWLEDPGWGEVSEAGGGSSGEPTLPWHDVLRWLDAVPNDDDGLAYDDWLRVVMGVHYEAAARGCLGEGLDAIETWSARCARHDERFLRERVWPYLKAQRGGQVITGRTIREMACAHGAAVDWQDGVGDFVEVVEPPIEEADWLDTGEEPLPAVRRRREERWLKAIAECSDVDTLRGKIVAGVQGDRRLRSDAVAREIVTKAWRDRLRELTGVNVRITEARRALKVREAQTDQDGGADWLRPWVYVQQEDLFLHRQSKIGLSTKAFDLTFTREAHMAGVDLLDEGGMTATRYATLHGGVRRVLRGLYMPACSEFFRLDGEEYINLYRPGSAPAMPDPVPPEGRAAITAWERHFQWLLGTEWEAELLLDWLTYQVQYPGQKVRWAVLICGQEGDGKSIIGQMLMAVMGQQNVRVIGSHQLQSRFTSWAHGAAVGILEEVYVPGHNRHEAVNQLKPLITNDVIEIHPKGKAPFNAPNTMNYLAFTNHEDALPQAEEGRRWFAVRTRFRKGELREEMQRDPGYFERLAEGMHNHAGSLRRWLLERQVSKAFRPQHPAPETAFLQRMRAMSQSDEVVLVADLLEDDVPGVTKEALSVPHLVEAARVRYGVVMRTRAVAKALDALGYCRIGRVTVGKRQVRAYSAEGVDAVKAQTIIANSLVGDFDSL